jgi:hypothetical protein
MTLSGDVSLKRFRHEKGTNTFLPIEFFRTSITGNFLKVSGEGILSDLSGSYRNSLARVDA